MTRVFEFLTISLLAQAGAFVQSSYSGTQDINDRRSIIFALRFDKERMRTINLCIIFSKPMSMKSYVAAT